MTAPTSTGRPSSTTPASSAPVVSVPGPSLRSLVPPSLRLLVLSSGPRSSPPEPGPPLQSPVLPSRARSSLPEPGPPFQSPVPPLQSPVPPSGASPPPRPGFPGVPPAFDSARCACVRRPIYPSARLFSVSLLPPRERLLLRRWCENKTGSLIKFPAVITAFYFCRNVIHSVS